MIPEQISQSISSATSHAAYGDDYFKWQSEIGRFGGWANVTKFSKHLSPQMRVLDFGCGGGYLLSHIECRAKLGIEINPVARAEAMRYGIATVASAAEIEDHWAEALISNHALEHCREPLRELEQLLPKVVPGGTVVFVLPCESVRYKYRMGDPNQHLYTWSPMSAANLFTEAGFDVTESKAYVHSWPPRFIPRLLRTMGGRPLFDFGCRIYGALTYLSVTPCTVSQIRVVAKRPLDQ